MRRTVLVLTVMAACLVVASGVALAVTAWDGEVARTRHSPNLVEGLFSDLRLWAFRAKTYLWRI